MLAGALSSVSFASEVYGGMSVDGTVSASINGQSVSLGVNDLDYVRLSYRPISGLGTAELLSVDQISDSTFLAAMASPEAILNQTAFQVYDNANDVREVFISYSKDRDAVFFRNKPASGSSWERVYNDFVNSPLYRQLSGASGQVRFQKIIDLGSLRNRVLLLLAEFITIGLGVILTILIARVGYAATFGILRTSDLKIKRTFVTTYETRDGRVLPRYRYDIINERGENVRSYRSYREALADKESNSGIEYRDTDPIRALKG